MDEDQIYNRKLESGLYTLQVRDFGMVNPLATPLKLSHFIWGKGCREMNCIWLLLWSVFFLDSTGSFGCLANSSLTSSKTDSVFFYGYLGIRCVL